MNPDEFHWWEQRPCMHPWLGKEHAKAGYKRSAVLPYLDRVGYSAFRAVTSLSSGEVCLLILLSAFATH